MRRFAGKALVGYDMLAVVVAFGRTGPEEEPVLKRCVEKLWSREAIL